MSKVDTVARLQALQKTPSKLDDLHRTQKTTINVTFSDRDYAMKI